jgi:hypothetical protein
LLLLQRLLIMMLLVASRDHHVIVLSKSLLSNSIALNVYIFEEVLFVTLSYHQVKHWNHITWIVLQLPIQLGIILEEVITVQV